MIVFFGSNILCVTLFDEPAREDLGEPISIHGENMLMFLGVEDGYGVLVVVNLGISGDVFLGMSSVVSLGVPGLVAFSFPTHAIPSAVTSVLPG